MEDAAQDTKAHAPESGELCAVEGAVDKQNHAYQRKFYKEMRHSSVPMAVTANASRKPEIVLG